MYGVLPTTPDSPATTSTYTFSMAAVAEDQRLEPGRVDPGLLKDRRGILLLLPALTGTEDTLCRMKQQVTGQRGGPRGQNPPDRNSAGGTFFQPPPAPAAPNVDGRSCRRLGMVVGTEQM